MAPVLEVFYRELLYALGEYMRRPTATAQGAPRIVKRVALDFGLTVEHVPLPRLTRAELEDQAWVRSRGEA